MVVKPNTITVNKKDYEDMCKALVTETKKCEYLKETLRQVKRYACSMDVNALSRIYVIADDALYKEEGE